MPQHPSAPPSLCSFIREAYLKLGNTAKALNYQKWELRLAEERRDVQMQVWARSTAPLRVWRGRGSCG